MILKTELPNKLNEQGPANNDFENRKPIINFVKLSNLCVTVGNLRCTLRTVMHSSHIKKRELLF